MPVLCCVSSMYMVTKQARVMATVRPAAPHAHILKRRMLLRVVSPGRTHQTRRQQQTSVQRRAGGLLLVGAPIKFPWYGSS